MKLAASKIIGGRLGLLFGILFSIMLAAPPAALAQDDVSSGHKRVVQDPAAAALNHLLASAQAALDKNDFETAAQDYQEYLAKKPGDAVAHFQLGYAYTAMQKIADAKAEYEKAIEINPDMDVAYLNLGLTLLDTDPAAAIEPLQKAAELKPDEPRPKFLLGLAYERTGKVPEAIEQYQAAEKLDDKNFDLRFALGRSLLRANRASEAEPEFQAAIALRPDSAPAHLGLAQTLLSEKKFNVAEAALSGYLAVQPKDTEVRIDHASVLVDLEKYEEAIAELDKAAAAGPETVRALKLRSDALFELKRYAEAVPVLEKALALAPQDPEIPARLGHVYLEKKDYANAVKELAVALKMDPNSNDVLADLVGAEYLNKNYPAALQGIDLLSQRKTLPIGSVFIRATCYDRLGQAQLALDSYKKFLDLNKDENSDMYFEATARARTLTRELEKKR
jgi:tetratricopeptide (TPR) repeat protein